MVPELGSLATFPASQFENNSGLCGFPLPLCKQSVADTQQSKSHKRQAVLTGGVMAVFSVSLFGTFLIVFLLYK
jgi:protein brassinosteroid insensitive 1